MKKAWKKILVLLIVFCGAVAGVVWFTGKDEETTVQYETLTQPGLPVIYAEYQGERINRTYGYTEEMDARYMREGIIPLNTGEGLSVYIDGMGENIVNIYYEIRSLDTERLVEKQQITDWETEGDGIRLNLEVENLLEDGREYLLIFRVSTEDKQDIYYYTRIVKNINDQTGQMIQFAKDFQQKALAGDSSGELVVYMKQTTGDRDTLGHVSLNSTYSQVIWGDLSPVMQGDVEVMIEDINPTIGTIRLEYQVEISDEDGGKRSCYVTERYCIQQSSSQWYLLTYDRYLDQKFEGAAASLSQGELDLGIRSSQVEAKESPDQTWQAFALDGDLWSVSGSANELNRIFSFRESESDVRSDYNAHGIQVVNVQNNGNVDFIVYGYMNRGRYEGQTGLVFYEFERETKVLKEVFFLPADKPYQILREEMGLLSYISPSRLFYLMFDDTIYAVDFSGNEFVTIVENVSADALVISEDSSMIAWEERDDEGRAQKVQVYYLDSGVKTEIAAPEGEYIRVLGFMERDVVYGFVREEDSAQGGLTEGKPMYAVEIRGEDGTVQIHYEEGGIYVTGVDITAGSIRLERAVKAGDGWQQTTEDALIRNEESGLKKESPVRVENAEARRAVYRLSLDTEAQASSPELSFAEQIQAQDSSRLDLMKETGEIKNQYYAYNGNRLTAICDTAAEAVDAVYDSMGVVLDSQGGYIMRRGYRQTRAQCGIGDAPQGVSEEDSLVQCLLAVLKNEGSSADVRKALEEGKNPEEILDEQLEGSGHDLSGVSLSQILYFYISEGRPIIAKESGGWYTVIIGYDSEDIYLYDLQSGGTRTMDIDEAETYFAANGNIFWSYTR